MFWQNSIKKKLYCPVLDLIGGKGKYVRVLTINVPVVTMAQVEMILMRTNLLQGLGWGGP
jgi:hypothetical protein